VKPSALLDAAHGIVAEQLARLRDLHQSALQRYQQLEAELRQSERQLDELITQRRFAAEHGLARETSLLEREQQLRAEHEARRTEQEQLRRALRQLDQLVRQIDMSSATLSGGAEGEPA